MPLTIPYLEFGRYYFFKVKSIKVQFSPILYLYCLFLKGKKKQSLFSTIHFIITKNKYEMI